MEKKFENLIKENWKKEYLYTIVFSFLAGLVVHLYKFTNNLPNHDSMYSFYSNQNVVSSGRWFLSVACGLSSYYDLPWVNGVLSLLFIAFSCLIVIMLFEIKNKKLSSIVCALFIVFPGTTEILCYEFTADGYFFAMLLSALAAYLLIKAKNNINAVLIAAVLVCLSCGIYQAFLSFYIVLCLCYVIFKLFDDSTETKALLKYIVRLVFATLIGLALYYAVWKICMHFQNAQPTNYQAIDELGVLSFSGLIGSFKSMAVALFSLFFEKNVMKHGFSVYAVLNIIFMITAAIVFIISVVKSKIIRTKSKFIWMILCVAAIPFAACIWLFASSGIEYGPRMLHSIAIVYVLVILLCNKYCKNYLKYAMLVLCTVFVFNLAVQANIAYYYLNYEYENTYAEALELKIALDNKMKDENIDKIAILGNREVEAELEQTDNTRKPYIYTNKIEKSLLLDSYHTRSYLENVFYFDGEYVNQDEAKEIENSKEYKNMKPFFDGGNVEIINDTVTVKLG